MRLRLLAQRVPTRRPLCGASTATLGFFANVGVVPEQPTTADGRRDCMGRYLSEYGLSKILPF
jgi:hypothetical protein